MGFESAHKRFAVGQLRSPPILFEEVRQSTDAVIVVADVAVLRRSANAGHRREAEAHQDRQIPRCVAKSPQSGSTRFQTRSPQSACRIYR